MLKFFKWIAGLFKAKPEELKIPKPIVDIPLEKPVIERPPVVRVPFKRAVKKSKEKFENNYVKVFGMQRTGTTFLKALCYANFKNATIFTNEFGWKHGYPFSNERFEKWPEKYSNFEDGETKYNYYSNIVSEVKRGNRVKFIIIIKNPYSWYYSIRRYRRSQFSMDSLSKEYKIYSDRYKGYEEFYRSLAQNIYGEGCIIRYEDLIRNTESVLRHISKELDIELKTSSVIIPNQVDQSRSFNEKQKKFYLSTGNFKLTQYLVDMINDNVDWEVLNFFGYMRIEKGE
jgi:hypothetical protein